MIIDIIVPTYNRYYALTEFFERISILDTSLYMLWIVDDCSTFKDSSVIPNWKNIHFIELTENLGQAGARNYAIARSVAPFIISLDDDAWFMEDSTDLKKIINGFEKYIDAGCLMFNIKTPISSLAADIDGQKLPLHVTCGCAYRRQALEQIGGFTSLIRGQSEESDISLKLYKYGWTIRSLYSIHVFHDFEPSKRTDAWYKKIRYNETRNTLIVAFLYYPMFTLLWYIPGKAIKQLLFTFKAKRVIIPVFLISLKGIFDFLRLIPSLIKMRNPLSLKTFKLWRRLFTKQCKKHAIF